MTLGPDKYPWTLSKYRVNQQGQEKKQKINAFVISTIFFWYCNTEHGFKRYKTKRHPHINTKALIWGPAKQMIFNSTSTPETELRVGKTLMDFPVALWFTMRRQITKERQKKKKTAVVAAKMSQNEQPDAIKKCLNLEVLLGNKDEATRKCRSLYQAEQCCDRCLRRGQVSTGHNFDA